MRRVVLVLLLFVVFVGAACTFQNREGTGDLSPTVILISFDGWRWDYHTKAPTPNLRSLMARGVRAENLIPSFPSKTFPNHYTIVTGLYPGHHGIVSNSIKDPATGRTFALSKPDEIRDPMWWGGEPLWVTAQRQGLSAAAMFWAGSEAPIGGVLPRYTTAYDESYPANDRVDQVLRWLDLSDPERPTFITLYTSLIPTRLAIVTDPTRRPCATPSCVPTVISDGCSEASNGGRWPTASISSSCQTTAWRL